MTVAIIVVSSGLYKLYNPDLVRARANLIRLTANERCPFTVNEVLFADYDRNYFVFWGTMSTSLQAENRGVITGSEFEHYIGRPGLLIVRAQGSGDRVLFGIILSGAPPSARDKARMLEILNRYTAPQ